MYKACPKCPLSFQNFILKMQIFVSECSLQHKTCQFVFPERENIVHIFFGYKTFDHFPSLMMQIAHRYDSLLNFCEFWNVNGFMEHWTFFFFWGKISIFPQFCGINIITISVASPLLFCLNSKYWFLPHFLNL